MIFFIRLANYVLLGMWNRCRGRARWQGWNATTRSRRAWSREPSSFSAVSCGCHTAAGWWVCRHQSPVQEGRRDVRQRQSSRRYNCQHQALNFIYIYTHKLMYVAGEVSLHFSAKLRHLFHISKYIALFIDSFRV